MGSLICLPVVGVVRYFFLDVKMGGKEWALAGKMPGLGSMPGREQVTHGFFLDIGY